MNNQTPMAKNTPIPPNLIDTLQSAQHIVVLTGAGISAESQIPTFRDTQTGLWAKYRPEELATPQAFRRNPKDQELNNFPIWSPKVVLLENKAQLCDSLMRNLFNSHSIADTAPRLEMKEMGAS